MLFNVIHIPSAFHGHYPLKVSTAAETGVGQCPPLHIAWVVHISIVHGESIYGHDLQWLGCLLVAASNVWPDRY